MFKGKPVKEVEFYNLLFNNNEFTSEYGWI